MSGIISKLSLCLVTAMAALFAYADIASAAPSLDVAGDVTITSGSLVFPDGTAQGSAAEARLPISDCITINAPGSYYLTNDITAVATCIVIASDNVSLDLKGYTITGPGKALGGYNGIVIQNFSNIQIMNGTIRDFGNTGIVNGFATDSLYRIINLNSINNGGPGISIYASGVQVKGCAVSQNSGIGIVVGANSIVTGNTVSNNAGGGISTSEGSIISGNVVNNNTGTGIWAGAASSITANTVYSNTGDGIHTTWSTVAGNTLYGNGSAGSTAGIYADTACSVKGNTVRNTTGHNIYVTNSGSTIEENLVTNSLAGTTYGVYFAASGNYYANNRARGNSTNFYTTGTTQTDGGGNTAF